MRSPTQNYRESVQINEGITLKKFARTGYNRYITKRERQSYNMTQYNSDISLYDL